MNLIWSESAQRLWSSGICKIPWALIVPMGMGKWPWRCTPTGLDSSNELDLEWIWSGCWVMASAAFGRTNGRTKEWWMDGEHSKIPFFPAERAGDNKMWYKITDPFQNFNSAGVEVWEWMNKFITLYNGCNYLSLLGLKLIHVNKRSPWASTGTVGSISYIQHHLHIG